MRSEKINFRVEPELKLSVEAICATIGLSVGEACRMFFKQITLHNGLPFEARIPNAETQEAIRELQSGGGERMSHEAFRKQLASLRKK